MECVGYDIHNICIKFSNIVSIRLPTIIDNCIKSFRNSTLRHYVLSDWTAGDTIIYKFNFDMLYCILIVFTCMVQQPVFS